MEYKFIQIYGNLILEKISFRQNFLDTSILKSSTRKNILSQVCFFNQTIRMKLLRHIKILFRYFSFLLFGHRVRNGHATSTTFVFHISCLLEYWDFIHTAASRRPLPPQIYTMHDTGQFRLLKPSTPNMTNISSAINSYCFINSDEI